MKNIIDGEFLALLETHDLQVKKAFGGAFGGNRPTRAHGSSAEFADFRDYIQGDDLRYIDWNLYARFEKLLLKLYVDERQLHHRIYIDASASMDWGKENKAYAALRFAAALAFLAVQLQDRISIHLMHENRCEELCKPFADKETLYKTAAELNKIKFYGDTDMETAIKSSDSTGYGDGISFIFSDFLTDSDFKSAVDHLLYKKREVCLIQILSPDELSPTLRGKVQMLDSEGTDIEDLKNYRTEVTRASLKAYEEALLWHQKDLRTFCASRNVGFLFLRSDEPIEKILFTKATQEGLIK